MGGREEGGRWRVGPRPGGRKVILDLPKKYRGNHPEEVHTRLPDDVTHRRSA